MFGKEKNPKERGISKGVKKFKDQLKLLLP
jgi:hypothetical protein